jgi:hypothetical protein
MLNDQNFRTATVQVERLKPENFMTIERSPEIVEGNFPVTRLEGKGLVMKNCDLFRIIML